MPDTLPYHPKTQKFGRKRKGESPMTNATILADIGRTVLMDKSDGRCWYCGKVLTVRTVQMDHVIAKNIGGSDEWSNLVPSCVGCNAAKSDQTLEDFRDSRGGRYFHFEVANLTP